MKIPAAAPDMTSLLALLGGDRAGAIMRHLAEGTIGGRYLHWDNLRRREPPGDLSSEEWWLAVKLSRSQGRRFLRLDDIGGRQFSYVITDEMLGLLHKVDRFASGRVELPEQIASTVTRDRYLVSSLMEEAISSSLLEGAATTRRDAKALLRSGRAPRTQAEIMVVNNYRTMQHIRDDLDEPLSVATILEIHQMVTEGTLDDPADAGRVQQPGERRVDVGDVIDPSIVYHYPPEAEDVPRMLHSLVSFANALDAEPFVHPVVRAITLHFYLSYVHPFVDGNGRTARALFYRSMLRQGYWLAEFLSISRLLYRAPVKYGRAFLHTETDEADLTYFLLHQLDVLSRAIDELLEYLATTASEVRQVERALRQVPGLNYRQLALLSHAVRHPDAVYTFESHRASHDVAYQTARADLLDLEVAGFLERIHVGRQFRYRPAPRLVGLLTEGSPRQ